MIAGHHLIWTVYGYWLPNDPRGSTSREIRSVEIAKLGELHFGRRKVQPSGKELNTFRAEAAEVLKYPLLNFSEEEFGAIGESFAEVIRKANYTCYACAIMPDHVHLLIRKHRDQADQMIEKLQDASRLAVLAKAQASRAADHPVWGGPGWKVFLRSREAMERTVRYIENNPVKIGRPLQHWKFVRPYDGWMPGQVRIVKKRNSKE